MSTNEEVVLDVLLSKFNNNNYDIVINCDEFPNYMKFSIKDYMFTLKYFGLISFYDFFIDGTCNVTLAPDALQYYNKKGSRTDLFDEMTNDEKELLKELQNLTNTDISNFLNNKLEEDEENIYRGIIGSLKSNGLINVMWADNKVYSASLTQNGRTYFEREKKYMNRINKGVVINNGTVFMGDVINSTVTINNTFDKIEQEINEKCSDENEKEELLDLLSEAKEIIENYKTSNTIGQRKGFFKKITNHLDTHGWFYAEIVSLFGQFVLSVLGGK